jgi:monofunctional biosynthetic peptidoglycan transglycosylase
MIKGLIGLLIAIASILALVAIGIAVVFVSLPDVRSLKGCLTTELYHVELCKTSAGYTPYDQISKHIVDATVMSEDASFYSHNGVDLVEMKESFKRDLEEHRFARGASTITQQLVKNVFLSNEKSLLRKGQEIYLALQLEKTFNKQQILTFYLNVVEFGDGIYGVKSASRYYFNKSPAEVTPEQAAFLAFLLPNPKKYSQSFKKKALTPFASKSIKMILGRMLKSHRLSDEDYTTAIARVGSHLWSGEVMIPDSPETGSASDANEENSSMYESPMGIVEPPVDEKNFKFDEDEPSPESPNNSP